MGVYKPREVLVDGAEGCGLAVDVALVGERFEVIETELDTSAFGRQVSSSGEGTHMPTDETSVYIRATAVASRLACQKCGICIEEADYSVTLERPVYLPAEGDQSRVVELETVYAEAVIDMSGARGIAKGCANGNTRQLGD